ncbi:hypothetical protein N7523_005785 [Penicillium sp. IBT 18751x]|nr:hypothetical protein N7523_005785 [Penicillium sp. IBT 18751x]
MATYLDATVVEAIIGYSFRSKEHLVQALTAAGAEEHNHDGNRKLAHLGSNVLRFILSFLVFDIAPSRSGIANLESSIISITQRAAVADSTGIDKCIKYSMRQGSRSPKVMALAIDAIFGAVYIDSTDFNASWKVALKLGLVSADFLGSSVSLTQLMPDMLDPSSSLFSHSDAVEDVGSSLQPILSTGTPYNPEMLSRTELIEEGFIGVVASENILPNPVDDFADFEFPMVQKDSFWTSLQRISNEDESSPEEISDVSGSQESACFVREIDCTRDSPPYVAGDSEENIINFSGQISTQVENEHGRPMSAHHYQALLVDDWLNSFIEEENKKCQCHKYPLPFETFLTPLFRLL